MTKALVIGICALVNNPDLLASYAHDAAGVLQAKIDVLTAGDLATQITQASNLISDELGAAIDKAMKAQKALIDPVLKESVESLVVRAVKLVIGDDPKAYSKGFASGVVPDANNFFKRLIAALMQTTAAPLIKKAVHWVVKDAKFIAKALVRTLNAFGPLLDKPKVKAAYQKMHKVYTDTNATASDKKDAAKAFRSALRAAVRGEFPSLELSRLVMDKFNPVNIVAKSLATNITEQLDILKQTLGEPIANALVSNGQKEFMQEYLNITLKYYIMVLVVNFLSFGPGNLTSKESNKFLTHAANFALGTQVLPAPVAGTGKKMLQKGIEVIRTFNKETPPEMIPETTHKTNLLFRFILGSYKVLEAAMQETLDTLKKLQRRITRVFVKAMRSIRNTLRG